MAAKKERNETRDSVVCISFSSFQFLWKGSITLIWTGKQTEDFQVATRDFQPKSANKSFSFSGYRFTLTDLKPYPGGKEESESVTFKYEKE